MDEPDRNTLGKEPIRPPGWFWLEVGAGIVVSGGLFGVTITFTNVPVAVIAFVVGVFFAALPALLIVLLVGSFSILCGLPTTRCGAAVAGAIAGLIATHTASAPFPFDVIASLFGAAGGGGVALWRRHRYEANGPLTVLGLMGRTTYFAVLFTVWRISQTG